MERYPLYIFDLDGTLYRGNEPIANAADTVRALSESGAKIRYLTNNSGQTRAFFLDKLIRMGFPCEMEAIYTSGVGSASYLAANGLKRVFAIGEPGLVTTLRDHGLEVANAGSDLLTVSAGSESDAVLAGICRHFNYDLMNGAMQRIRAGQPFIATNPDVTYPMEEGRLIPGAGSVVAGIQACSEAEPYVVGKPNPYLIRLILEELGFPPTSALVVGDRVDTDLVSGERAGCPTHLVLTGVTSVPPEGQSFSVDLTGLL
ncbi:MAG: HAD-IIA family hydrolase [Fimbriimonas sp.]|nr:HAD-IIA family hydrolase [Fimbriimonas sp.]